MKKGLVVIFAFLLNLEFGRDCQASPNIPPDKAAHFGISYMAIDVLYRICMSNDKEKDVLACWLASGILTLGMGTVWEMQGNKDWMDIQADCLGVVSHAISIQF